MKGLGSANVARYVGILSSGAGGTYDIVAVTFVSISKEISVPTVKKGPSALSFSTISDEDVEMKRNGL